MYFKVLVYTKTVDSGFRALWFATQDGDIQGYSTPSDAKLEFLVSNTGIEKNLN